MIKRLLWALFLLPALAGAQQLVNCEGVYPSTNTPCTTTLGAQAGGDPSWYAFGKFNADVNFLYANIPTLPISIANGGTGTASPGLIAGTNITITGSWPSQTINASGGGSSSFNALTGGTNTTAAMLLGTGASLGPTSSGTVTANVFSGTVPIANGGTAATSFAAANLPVQTGAITSGHCVQWATAISITDSGATCGAGGSSTTFSTLTSSTNTTAAMLVGTGASLAPTGSGTVTANLLSSGIVLGTPASGVLTNETGLPLPTGVTGTLQAANEPAHSGDVTNTAGSLAMTVKGINGVTLSGLSTGILKNTTTTGVPSIAVSGDFPTLNQSTTGNAATATALASVPSQCTGSQFSTGVTANGTANCATPAGSGNVSNTGTPTNGQMAQWTSATVIQGLATTGTGSAVLASSPTLVSPALGTPTAATLTNATGLPISTGVSGLASGVATFLATPSSANLAAAVTNETGTGAVVFAVSPTFTTPNIDSATASGLTLSGITGATQCLHVNTSGIVSGTGVDCGSGGSSAFSGLTSGTNTQMAGVLGTGASLVTSGSGTIAATSLAGLTGLPSQANQTVIGNGGGSSAVPVALTLAGNLVATASTLGTSQTMNAQTGASYALSATDAGKLLTLSNASPVAVSLSQATTTGFTAGFSFDVENLGVGIVTITPATSTINGATTLTIAANKGCTITSDGANYQVSACTAVGVSIDAGTTFTLGTGTGACLTKSTLVGGSAAGSFVCTGTGGASTVIINLPTAPHQWGCWSVDQTTVADTIKQSANSATSVTLSGTIAANDAIYFGCTGS